MELTAKSSTSNNWIVYTGISQHISAQREQFLNYPSISTIKIEIGDGSEIEAIGKGVLELTTGKNAIKLQDVLNVPRIGSNLFCVAKIVNHGLLLIDEVHSRFGESVGACGDSRCGKIGSRGAAQGAE